MTLYQGDFREVLPTLQNGSVNLIVTDPPYPKEYIPLYGSMAFHAKRILARGGSLLAIVPHYAMPRVLVDVSEYLKYRWMFSMWQVQGAHPRMAMGIEIVWKPIVWWVNEVYPQGRGFIKDGFENDPVDKLHHKWEQSLSWAEHCLKLARPGDTVLDPMMGSGTVGVACKKLGLNFIGIEINPEDFVIASERIAVSQ